MIAVAVSELRLLVRNRLVALAAVVMPLLIGAWFVLQPLGAGAGITAVLQVMLMVGMGTYLTATTTLAARRQNLVLKRLRSGTLSDGGVIVGLTVPIVIVNLIQVIAVLIALAISSGEAPAHLWLLALTLLAIQVMFAGFALATAGVTNSAEHAQFTTLPVLFGVLGVAFWSVFSGGVVGAAGSAEQWIQRLAPGGAAAELIVQAWGGLGTELDLGLAMLLLGITVAWAAVAVLSARWLFRWEPRR